MAKKKDSKSSSEYSSDSDLGQYNYSAGGSRHLTKSQQDLKKYKKVGALEHLSLIKSVNPQIKLAPIYKLYQKERNGWATKPSDYLEVFMSQLSKIESTQKKLLDSQRQSYYTA
jgi:hypothetical protein